jgi:3-dehydroquinate synthase
MIVPVRLGNRSYSIVVERGALASVGDRLVSLDVGRRAALVTDPGIRSLHGQAVLRGLRAAGFTTHLVEVPPGEAAKTLAVAERCWNGLLEAGLDRTSTVIALGGGAVGDLAGFVAATYMRGVNLAIVPTTVLAQVDSSIGGKTAIDHPRAKNLIGAFHQPRLVVADPVAVLTLPARDYRSGLAEMAKHGVVLDAGYFDALERDAERLVGRDLDALEPAIGGSCRLKAGVVERDEREAELRHVLNHGHTIGHAIEAATGYHAWTHGEAVALGMAAEARLARRLGITDEDTVARIETLLVRLGLPVRMPRLDAATVLGAIAHDKKARDGRVPFVLAPRIGTFRLVQDAPEAAVRSALEEIVV